jgi:malonyl-CoA O-methyltransferase
LSGSTRRTIDAAALQRVAERQAGGPAPWLHAEVARRMVERLAVIRTAPSVVVDWWSAAGASRDLLKQTYPRAQVLPVERVARVAASGWRRLFSSRATAAVEAAAVTDGAAQLVWANMMLHTLADPGAALAEWRRVLAVDGFLMFSTLGPGTLASLRALYRDAGWGSPHAPFVDMHDLGDMLVAAGFADPVMDQETLTLTWATPDALLAELRALGANADPQRFAGLRTPRWKARLAAALAERAGADGRIALGFEVVYGHAFNPPPRAKVAAETRVAPEDLQRMARRGRRDGSLG